MVEGAKVLGEALAAGRRRSSRSSSTAAAGPGRSPPTALLDQAYAAGQPGLRPRAGRAGPGGRHRHARSRSLAVVPQIDVPLADLRRAGADLVVVCVDVRDPGNAGTVLRSAEAAGAGGVVCCDGSVDVFNPKTVRASAGALFHVPVVVGRRCRARCSTSWADGACAGSGTAARGGVDYTDADLTGPVALVLGNEAHGLPDGLAGRARRAGDHPDGRPGRVAQRRHGGGRAVLRGRPPAPAAATDPTRPR